MYVEDFLDYLECLLDEDNKSIGDINIGSGKSHSVYEVANMIASIIEKDFHQEVKIVFNKQVKESVIIDNRLSIEKARSASIIKGNTTLADSLKRYIVWGRGESIFSLDGTLIDISNRHYLVYKNAVLHLVESH